MITYVAFIAGFLILIAGAHYLVEGASALGIKLGLSPLIIGLTVVSLGTSLPELIINVYASIAGDTGLAIGNVLGSNVMNTLLIVGVTALIFPIKASSAICRRDVWINLIAVVVLFALANLTWGAERKLVLSRPDGGILLLAAAFYTYMVFRNDGASEPSVDQPSETKHRIPILLLMIIGGIAGLFFGGRWIVGSVTTIGTELGISSAVMGATIVAAATSLPELVTSIVAALKKNTDIALGNVLGSNIYNIFLVLGISALIEPIPFLTKQNMDLAILLTAGVFLILVIRYGKTGRTVSRVEGLLLTLGYALFIYWTLINTY